MFPSETFKMLKYTTVCFNSFSGETFTKCPSMVQNFYLLPNSMIYWFRIFCRPFKCFCFIIRSVFYVVKRKTCFGIKMHFWYCVDSHLKGWLDAVKLITRRQFNYRKARAFLGKCVLRNKFVLSFVPLTKRVEWHLQK